MNDLYLHGAEDISGETESNPFLGAELGFLPMVASALMPSLISRVAPMLMRSGIASRALGIIGKTLPGMLAKTRVPKSFLARATQALAKGGTIPQVMQAAIQAPTPEQSAVEADRIRELNPNNQFAQNLADVQGYLAGEENLSGSELGELLEGACVLAGFLPNIPGIAAIGSKIAQMARSVAPVATKVFQNPIAKTATKVLPWLAPAVGIAQLGYDIFKDKKPTPAPVPANQIPPSQITTAPKIETEVPNIVNAVNTVNEARRPVSSSFSAIDALRNAQPIVYSGYTRRKRYKRRRSRATVETVVYEKPRSYRSVRKRTYKKRRFKNGW